MGTSQLSCEQASQSFGHIVRLDNLYYQPGALLGQILWDQLHMAFMSPNNLNKHLGVLFKKTCMKALYRFSCLSLLRAIYEPNMERILACN